MPITVKNQRVRLQLDLSRWFQSTVDVITDISPNIANGSDLQFEVAFSYGELLTDAQLASVTNWASVKLTLKDTNDKDGAGYWSKTLTNGDLNTGLTLANWQAGTDQHCIFPISNAQNSLVFTGASQLYWLVVEIDTSDSPAKIFPAIVFPVTVIDTGVGTAAPVSVTPDLYYTQAQSDARYAQSVNLNAKANLAGATFTGAVILASSQMSGASGVYATTKTYVDAGDAATLAASVPNTGVSTIAGAKTFSSLATFSTGITTSGTITLGALSGVLKATAGVVAGSATTTDLTEGSNLYHTDARTRSAVLTGFVATTGTVAATDTVLQAIQKLAFSANTLFAGATSFTDVSQSAMLLHTGAVKGDFSFRSDLSTVFIYKGGGTSTLANWTQIFYPVSSVNGLTGALTLTTTNIAEGTNLYWTSTRFNSAIAAVTNVAGGVCPLDSNVFVPWANLPPLTGYTSGAGTITAADTILSAIQKLNGNIAAISSFVPLSGGTMSGKLGFSGSTNFGLVVNQLSASQIGVLSTSSTNWGCIVYDTTNNLLKALVDGAFVTVAGDFLPLTAGSGNPLSATLYFNDGLTTAMQIGTNWSQRTSNSNGNYDFRYSTTTALTIDQVNSYVAALNGYSFNTTSLYKVNATQVVTSRQTGWTDPSGTSSKATFATSTVVVSDLAKFVYALYIDLKTHGLIGN